MIFRAIFSFLFYIIISLGIAQDTLKISIHQADSIFLKNNLILLASSMNIKAQKAQIIQAKTYPNPLITADVNAYDPDNNKTFHIGQTGQKGFQLEQLILLSGKRKLEIEMAKTNVNIAELEFQQLLRQLKFRLHTDLFMVGQQQFLLQKYNYQLSQLDTLLLTYQTQADKGNIPLKEVVRLKGAYLKLSNDRAELLKNYYATQSSLQTLLQTTSIINFNFLESEVEKYIQIKTLTEIQSVAAKNRPELLVIQQNKTLAEQYLQFQKRLAIPDINMFTSYDQRGGAFNNQFNVGFTIPLPIWDRNKGNIKTSEYKIKEVDYNIQAMQTEITSSIQNAFSHYTQTISEYQKAKTLYNKDFEITINGMTTNFQKRNVSIVEFIDFFEAYNEVLTELTRIKTQLVISAEQINLLTGTDIY